MNVTESVLHALLDVAAGRRNLPSWMADELHEQITPGFTVEEPSDADLAAAQKVLDKAALAKQGAAAKAEGFTPAPV
jgi:hypothetical protein